MKVICDNCRAVYKIPDEKLAKPVNKATCRKCGHRMLIPRPRQGQNPDEKTLVTAVPPTPPPAPQRDSGRSRPPEVDRHTQPISEEEPEATMPGLTPQNGYGSGAYALSGTAQPGNTGVYTPTRQPAASPTLAPPPSLAPPEEQEGDDVPLYAATPMPTPDRDTRPASARSMPAPPAPNLLSNGTPAMAPPRASTRTPAMPPPRQPAPPVPSVSQSSTLGTGGDWKPSEAILASINPGQLSADPVTKPLAHAPAPQPAPLPRARGGTPAPAPMRAMGTNPGSVISVFDPANDLTLAMLSSTGGMVGTFILVLALLTVPSLPLPTIVLVAIGMLLAFIGGMATVLVIFTGGRGRRPARPLVSVILAVGCSFVVTTAGVGTLILRDQFVKVRDVNVATVPVTPSDEGSVLAASHPITPPPIETIAAPAGTPTTTPSATPATRPAGTPATPRSPTTSTSGGGPVAETFAPRNLRGGTTTATVYEDVPPSTRTTTPTSTPATSGDDEFAFLDEEPAHNTTTTPATPPKPAATGPTTVPDTVIDTILRNDVGIKKCFFNHQRATGSLPERVVVSFKITPAGTITGGTVTDAEFKGTDLDSCLGRALGAIAMPPSQNGQTVKYPFQLQ